MFPNKAMELSVRGQWFSRKDECRSGRLPSDLANGFCLQMEKFPFRFAKGLAKQFITSVPTMSRILKVHLALQNFSGRYLSHGLDDDQKRFKAGFPTIEIEF
jgi:hypothetical protein